MFELNAATPARRTHNGRGAPARDLADIVRRVEPPIFRFSGRERGYRPLPLLATKSYPGRSNG
jgi:hypothetical protein